MEYITYDESTFRSFNVINKGFLCFKNYERTQFVNFKDSFIKIPKVIIIPELFDIASSTVDYSLDILAITEKNFTLKIKCINGIVNAIQYRWIAIDDSRIQVISQFNIKDFKEQTFDFDNPNTQKYFISILSLSYIGIVDFQVKVTGITESKISVQITDPSEQLSNIISLGYQIVLGTNEMFTNFGLEQTNSVSAFIGKKYAIQPKSWFILPFSGFQLELDEQLSFQKIYNSDSTQQWYEMTAIGCCCFIAQKHEPVLIHYQPTFQYTPFSFGNVKIMQRIKNNPNYINSFQVQVEGKSNSITNLGETQQKIHKDEKLIQLIINVKCSSNENISSEFYYGSNPNINSIKFSQQCNGIFNEITYSVQLIPTVYAYSDLLINIKEEICEISQILYNQQLNIIKLYEIKKTIV